MMALIVEDGSIVTGADSYVDLANAYLLAAKYGVELPTDEISAEVALRNGASYVGLSEDLVCGSRVSATQSLTFPRAGVYMFGHPVAETIIPEQVILAQLFAAVEYGAGTDVRASTDGKEVSSVEVDGAVSESYFQSGNDGSEITITRSIDALKPLMCSQNKNNGISFNVMRG